MDQYKNSLRKSYEYQKLYTQAAEKAAAKAATAAALE